MSEPDIGRQIRKALLKILEHFDATLEPVRRGIGSHVQTSGEAPMPISAHVLDTRAMCRSRLAGWSLLVIEERDLHTEGLSGLDVDAMCDLLMRHADWLGDHEAGEVALDEIETSARDLAAIAAPRRREWMSLGICPLMIEHPPVCIGEVLGEPLMREVEPTPCGGTVRAYPDPEKDPYCDGCGTEAVTDWWERAMFGSEVSRLVTASELVVIIHREFGKVIKVPTIRKWVERGIIGTSGQDEQGRTLFDRGSVAYALARWAVA
jgi:hypothetical protein